MIISPEVVANGIYFRPDSREEHLLVHSILLLVLNKMGITSTKGAHEKAHTTLAYIGVHQEGYIYNQNIGHTFGEGAYFGTLQDLYETVDSLTKEGVAHPARYGVMTESPYSATLTVRPSLEEAEAYSQKLAGEQNISSAVIEFRKVGGYNVTSKLVYTVERLQLAEDIGESSDV